MPAIAVTALRRGMAEALPPQAYACCASTARSAPAPARSTREKRAGTFVCAGCDAALFDAGTKFESGTGWPSFFAPLEGGIGTTDRPQLLHDPHRGALRPLRRASRPCLPGRPAADRRALLHERRGDALRAGRGAVGTERGTARAGGGDRSSAWCARWVASGRTCRAGGGRIRRCGRCRAAAVFFGDQRISADIAAIVSGPHHTAKAVTSDSTMT